MYRVLKFGGTTLQDQDSRKKVIKIIKKYAQDKLIIVVSAMGRKPAPYATASLKELATNSISIDEISSLVGCGEIISSIVLSSEINQHNLKCKALSSYQAGMHVKNNQLVSIDVKRIKQYLKRYDVIILPGFQGIDRYNNLRILQPGDSDYSAVVIAQKFHLSDVYIYSDVCGIYSADPKFVTRARLKTHVGYLQALDLGKHKARIICYKALLAGYHQLGFKIHLRSVDHDEIGTLINHDDTHIKTMSIDFNYVLIKFNEAINKQDYRFLQDYFQNDYFVAKNQLADLKTPYVIIENYTKIHFVGCNLENDDIYQNFLEKFVIPSIKEKDSYYVKACHQQQDINLLHDLIVGDD